MLDEADTMLDMGFIDDVDFILGLMADEKQVCIFSATMPTKITELSRKYMNNPEKILIDSDEPSVETLDQYFAVLKHDEKLEFLTDLLQKDDLRAPSSSAGRSTAPTSSRWTFTGRGTRSCRSTGTSRRTTEITT